MLEPRKTSFTIVFNVICCVLVGSSQVPVEPLFRECFAITSIGGVSSSSLLHKLLRTGLVCNHHANEDGLKHLPLDVFINRTACSIRPFAVVYVYDDPALATASLYRRKFQYAHCVGMGTCHSSFADVSSSLDAYADSKIDVFGFNKHVSSYLNTPAPFDLVFYRPSARDIIHENDLLALSQILVPTYLKPYPDVYKRLLVSVFDAFNSSLSAYDHEERTSKYMGDPSFTKLREFYLPVWEEWLKRLPSGVTLLRRNVQIEARC